MNPSLPPARRPAPHRFADSICSGTIAAQLPAARVPGLRRYFAFAGRAAVLSLAFVVSAHAANQAWTGGGADANWSTPTNWNGGVPGSTLITNSTDVAIFNAAIVNTWGDSALNSIVVDANRNIFGINFDLLSGNYFIGSTGGNVLRLSNGGAIQILNSLSATNAIETVNAPLSLQGTAYSFSNNSANGSGAGAATLNFGGGITGTTGATVLTLSGSNTNANTISGIIGNGTATTLGLNKTGTGTWILNGSAVNTYTGTTTVASGTLVLDFANLATPTNLVSGSSPLSMGGGTLSVLGKSAAATSQTFASLGLTAGANKISLTPGASGGTVGLTITAAHVAPSNTAHASLQFSPTGTTTYTNTASLNQFVNGQFNYYGTFGTDNWARITTNVVGAIAGNDVTTDFTAAGDNNVTGGFTTNTGVDPNSIRFASASNLTVTQNNTTFFTGGILVASTAGTSAINGTGTIRPFGSGTGTIPTDWHIIQNSVNDFTVGNAILNNSSSRPLSLVKSGVGKLILNGANGYTGGTYINEGTVQVGNGSTTGVLGSGGVFNNGALIYNRSNLYNTDLNAISGTGSVIKEGLGQIVRGTASTYTGGTTINAGLIEVGNATGLGTGVVTVNSGELALNGGLTLANNIAVNGGTLTASNNGGSTYSGTVTIGASGATFSAKNWYDAVAQNGTIANTISGVGALTKTGGGDLTLSVANNYAGGTTISAGRIIAGNGSALGTGAVSIGTGAILSSSNVNLTIGALTLSGGGNISLGTVANTITSSGAVNVSGTGNLITLGGTAAAAGNTYSLISGTGVSASGISLTGGAVGGLTIALGTSADLGRTTYAFTPTATALQLAVTGGAFNLTWNGGNANWNTTDANWQKDGAGANIAFFAADNATISTANSIAVDPAGVTAGTVTVNNLTGTATLTGGTLTATSLIKSGAGTLQLSNVISGATLAVSGGELALGVQNETFANVSLTAGSITSTTGVLTGTGSAFDLRVGSVSAILNGNVGLTKSTSGTVTLSGANTYAGGTAVNAGTLALSGSGSLGNAAALILGGGTLALGGGSLTVGAVSLTAAASSGNTIENGSLTGTSYATSNTTGNALVTANLLANGAAGLTKSGAGTLTLTGANIYSGATIIKEGSLILDGGTNRLLSTGSVVLGDTSTTGKLVLGGSVAVSQTLSSLTTTGLGGSVVGGNASISTLTLDIAGISTYAGTLGGTGTNENNLALVKNGVGTLTISGNNSYTGGSTVNGGVLTLGAFFQGSGTAPGSGPITLKDATRLNLSTGNSTAAQVFIGTGLTVSGLNASATISSSNASSGYSGTVSGSLDQALNVSAAGGQQVNFSANTNQLQTFYGTVNVSGTIRFSSSTLGAAGNTNGSDNALFNVTGFMVNRNEGAIALGALTGNGTILAGGAYVGGVSVPSGNTYTIGARGTNADFSGSIQDSSATSPVNKASVIKTGIGIQTFSANNTYTGSTTVGAGTLLVSGSLSGTVSASVSTNATLKVTGSVNEAATIDVAGTLTGNGTVGTVNVNSGGTISPGNSPGTLTTSSETWANGGAYLWEINALAGSGGTQGTDPGWDYINGGAGTLNITADSTTKFTLAIDSLGVLTGWDNSANQSWTIASFSGGITGFSSDKFFLSSTAFGDENLLGSGSFQIAQVGANDLQLQFIAVPEPSSLVALIGGMACLLGLQRFRRRIV
jgi:fibronectin-binding autotransporter adhesin